MTAVLASMDWRGIFVLALGSSKALWKTKRGTSGRRS